MPSTPDPEALLARLADDLARPRKITPQVAAYLADRHEVTEEGYAAFLAKTLPGLPDSLEDYEVDLAFSPLFTPTWDDRTAYSTLLGTGNITGETLQGLIDRLEAQGVTATLVSPAGESLKMPLREVTISRYVSRLFLERPLPERLLPLLEASVPSEHRPAVAVVFRDTLWHDAAKVEMAAAFLDAFQRRGSFELAKVKALADFIRTYRPVDLPDLAGKLESLIASCEADLQNLPGRSFHDHGLKDFYVNQEEGPEKTGEAERVKGFYTHLIAMAQALLEDCRAMAVA